MELKFRPLKESEIQCRLAQCGATGLKLLIYKDARVDMELLDEIFGWDNWQRKYDKGVTSLWVRVKHDDGVTEWIEKADVGSESNVDPEKGLSSDSFKRSAVNYGIGRALYTAPNIWVYATDKDGKPNAAIVKDNNGKYSCKDNFSVEKIAYSEDGKYITGLAIRNDSLNKRVFVWQRK